MLKITIITVCYNEKDKLRKTIESVIQQTYCAIEYIVIDGGSTDGTVEMLYEYFNKEKLKFYSEKDYGIYNAMNRGITKASGNYVYFINSGDIFFDKDVITNVVSYIKDSQDIIYYGKVCLVYPDGFEVVQDFSKIEGNLYEKLLTGQMPCHQAIFAPKVLLRNHYFREEYTIRADYEWMMYSISKGNKCISIPLTISYYDVSGVSGRGKYNNLFLKEEEKIINEYKKDFIEKKVNNFQIEENLLEKKQWLKYNHMFQLMNYWLLLKQKNIHISDYLLKEGYQSIAIYGIGHMGLRLFDELKDNGIKVKYAIDQRADDISINLRVIPPDKIIEKVDAIIVTVITSFNEIENSLKEKINIPILSLEDMIYEMTLDKENR